MEEKQSYEYVMETNKVTPIKYSGIMKVILMHGEKKFCLQDSKMSKGN